MVINNNGENLGRILRQQRVLIPLTLRKLATISGISSSHLGRIERGERFPNVVEKLISVILPAVFNFSLSTSNSVAENKRRSNSSPFILTAQSEFFPASGRNPICNPKR